MKNCFKQLFIAVVFILNAAQMGCSSFDGVSPCSTGDLRLVDGFVANEGRVEICMSNEWGTVCDDRFSDTDATVVCRQLGYSATYAIAVTDAFYGPGIGPIFLDEVQCVGDEQRLIDCPHASVDNCEHFEDAGVECSGSRIMEPTTTAEPTENQTPSSKGNEFVLAFWSQGHRPTSPNIALFVTTDDPGPVSFTVDAPNTNIYQKRRTYTANAGQTTIICLPTDLDIPVVQSQDIRVFQITERNKGIHVKAEHGKKISVYGWINDAVSTEAFLALPCIDYGENAPDRYIYYVFSASIESFSEFLTFSSRFMIIPCEDDTEVNLIPSQTLEIAADISSTGFVEQVGPSLPMQNFEISLDSLETAMFQSPDDLTGTILESNKPITVTVGHECGQVPAGISACNVLVEQVPPHITYGTRFLTAPLQFIESGERYRIGSVSNSPNEVTVTCTSEDGTPKKRLTQTLTRGEYAEFNTSVGSSDSRREFCCIKSSLPATVMQYSLPNGCSVDLIVDPIPSMLYIPPVTQYLNDFTLTINRTLLRGFVSYTIPSQFFSDPLVDERKLLVNGMTFKPDSGYLPIYCPDKSTFNVCGYGAYSALPEGDHRIIYNQTGAGFFPFIYGLDIEISFEYPSGFELKPEGLPVIEIPDRTVPENIGSIEFPIRRVGGDLGLPSFIVVSSRDTRTGIGYATARSDYEAIQPTNSNFAGHRLRYLTNNELPRSADTLRITIIDDDDRESMETFQVYLVEIIQNSFVSKSIGTVTIVDDDSDPKVFFGDVVYNIQETQYFVQLVVRTNTIRLRSGDVLFYTEDGTASSSGDDPDYQAIPRANASSVIFPIGNDPLSTVIRIFISDDDVVEEVEYFYVRLIQNPDISVPFFNITEPMIQVNIDSEDDEFVEIGFESTRYNASEMDEFVSIVVKVFSGRLSGNINATLQLETRLGETRDQFDDFNETLIPGVVCLPIEVSIPKQVKEFDIHLSSPVNYVKVRMTLSTATVSITSNNVTCFISDECSDNSSITTMTERQCCVGSKQAKGFKITGNDTCFTCIVFGFFNGIFSGLEQNESYSVPVGFLKSGPGFEAQLQFEAMINLGTASKCDFTLHNSRVLISSKNENPEEIIFTFQMDDLAQEPDETVKLKLSVTSPLDNDSNMFDFSSMANAFFVDTLNLVIQDNDDVELEFTSIIFESNESSLFIPITMEFNKQLASPVTICVTPKTLQEHRLSGRPDPRDNDASNSHSNILPQTEADFADFDNSVIILSIPASEIVRSEVRVPINDDVIDEFREQDFVVTFEVIVAKNIVLPQHWDVIARIIDDDEIRISFNDTSYTFSESGDEFGDNHYQMFLTKEFGVLTEQTFEVVLTVNTNFSTTSHTQAAILLGHGDHADYNISKEHQNVSVVFLTFPQDLQTIPFDIYILDDPIAEASEAFQVVISPKENTPNFCTPESNVIVIISDNDVVTFGVEMNYTFKESDEEEEICGMVTSPKEDVPIVAEIELNIETADKRDIRRSNNHSQTINDQTRRACFLLTVVEDGIVESTETLSIEFRINSISPMIPFDLNPSKATITIPTNADGIIGFTETALQVNESDGPVTLDIEVLFGKLNGTVLICLSVVFTNSDLEPVGENESQSVLHEFGPDKVIQNVTIPILDDEMYEVSQNLIVSLSVVNVTSPDDRVTVEPSRSTVTILDNDFLTFKFGSDNYTTDENESSINIILDLVSGDTNLDIFAVVSTRNGSASANEADYVPLIKREVNKFQRSVNNTLRASFGIGINDDIFTEFNEYFTVEIIEIKFRLLGSANNVVLSEEELNRIYFDDETNVTIIDDDAVTIGFLGTKSLNRIVNEDPNSTITFNIGIIPPEGQLGFQLSILFQTFDNDTTVRRDYKPETQTVVFTSATESMSQSIDVVIIDDNDVEGMETFFVELVSSPNSEIPPHVTISSERLSVTIIDDDVIIGFSDFQRNITTMTVHESNGTIDFGIMLIAGSLQTPVKITFFTEDATAKSQTIGTDEADFNEEKKDITIHVCSLMFPTEVSVSILPDDVLEETEMFNVRLRHSDPNSDAVRYAKFKQEFITVHILDDDNATIGFDSQFYTIEEGGKMCIRVKVISGKIGRNVTIQVNTVDGSATQGEDYKVVSNTIFNFNGESSTSEPLCVEIMTFSDEDTDENDETFDITLLLSDAQLDRVVTIEPNSAQVVIRNKNRTRNAPRILRDLLVNKPNHLLKYNIGNNFCLENATAELNFTIYCNPIDSLEATNSTWWIFDRDIMEEVEIVNKTDNLCIEYSEDFNSSLLFGPATLLELAQYSNTSGENISITIGCRLTNEFGSDNETIEITQCAPDACQDGGTNNCNQKCSRDKRGIHKCNCADGYLLDTDNETCIATRCSDLDDPDNGMVEFSRTYQSVANYSCEPTMYILIPYDQNQRTCLSNGSWNGTAPTCRKCEGGAAVDGRFCEDICNSSNHNCTTSATCVSTGPGNDTFICTCSFFYQIQSDGVSCKVHTAVISVSVIVGIILLFIAIVLAAAGIRKYNNKLKQIVLKEQALLDAKDSGNLYADSQGTGLTQFTVQLSFDALKEIHKELLIYSANLRILDTIGQGEFGVVYKGHLLKDLGQTVTGVVAIKTLKGFVDETLVEGLLNECVKMQKFDHPNVLNLTGVCLDGGPTPFLVMPFMANGSLQSYLKKERSNLVISTESDSIEDLEKMAVTLKRLLDMCHQVAKGMEYIAGMRFIHRDLATRNCMIDINYVIKVADFGLSEQMESKNYFRQDIAGAMKLPFKWLALESLTDSIFSEKTDVWAFGVTCWEIFSGGKAPYSSINPAELSQRLESGYRLEKPRNEACSDQVYSVMMECWNADPDERPSFSELVKIISLYLESMAGYLHIGAFNKPSTDLEMSGQIIGSDSEACETNLTAASHTEASDNANVHVIDGEVQTTLMPGSAETAL